MIHEEAQIQPINVLVVSATVQLENKQASIRFQISKQAKLFWVKQIQADFSQQWMISAYVVIL